MARRADAEARQTYLVEHYRPGMEGEGLRSWATQVRDTFVAMEREGMPVRYLRSTIVPADESLLCILKAFSEELVREAYTSAGNPFERLSALAEER